MAEKVNKAYSMLWLIKRNFKDISAEAFVSLYKHLIRSHLEYSNSIWSPHKKSDIEKLERVQKRATKMIPGMPKISYPDSLAYRFGLPQGIWLGPWGHVDLKKPVDDPST